MKTPKEIKDRMKKHKDKVVELKSYMEKFSKLNKDYDCTFDVLGISGYEDLISELEWVLN